MRQSGGRRRPVAGVPAAGLVAMSMVLLATAAAPVGGDAPRALDPQAGGGNRPAARAGGSWRLPDINQAAGAVDGGNDAGPVIPTVFTGDIPVTVLDAYRHARDLMNKARPGCHFPLELVEAIGKVETNHARYGLVDANGTTVSPILGPVLDGNGFAAIQDTDGGRLDGDQVWDRAVGPMQFLPSTWTKWSADGNGDHRADPNNVFDASLAAARYLCAVNRDLGTPEGLDEAIFSYDQSTSYRNLVLAWMSTYASGAAAVPDATDLGGVVPAQLLGAPSSGGTLPANIPAGPVTPVTPGATNPPPTAPPPTAPVPPPTTTPAPPSSTPPVPPSSTTPPPAQPPAAPPQPGPVTAVVCGVAGVVGGLLGALTGSRPPNC